MARAAPGTAGVVLLTGGALALLALYRSMERSRSAAPR